jgi:hypothetical protein
MGEIREMCKKIFQHLTQHIVVLENNVGFVCHDVLSPDIHKTNQGGLCETME